MTNMLQIRCRRDYLPFVFVLVLAYPREDFLWALLHFVSICAKFSTGWCLSWKSPFFLMQRVKPRMYLTLKAWTNLLLYLNRTWYVKSSCECRFHHFTTLFSVRSNLLIILRLLKTEYLAFPSNLVKISFFMRLDNNNQMMLNLLISALSHRMWE